MYTIRISKTEKENGLSIERTVFQQDFEDIDLREVATFLNKKVEKENGTAE